MNSGGNKRAPFIVIGGPNNIGKSTQVKLLSEKLQSEGLSVEMLKYPIYELPSGQRISKVLRDNVQMTDVELQEMFAQNRREFEPTLIEILESGVWVIAEDYTITGKAWGVAKGIPIETMEEMNAGLLEENLTILLDGDQFKSGIERGHRHEDGGIWGLGRRAHLELASRYGLDVVGASQHKEKVASDIFDIVESRLYTILRG